MLTTIKDINKFLKENAPPHFEYGEFTYEEASEEIIKCSDVANGTGFLYFYYYYCAFPHPTKNIIRMRDSCYDWQKSAAMAALRSKRIISKKNRQVGFSTITQGYALWRAMFFENQKITVISLGQRESQEFLEKLEVCLSNLPKWLRPWKTVDMATKIKLKNKSEIKSLPNSPNAGRSSSISLLILDEFAEYGKNQKKIMSSAGPALGPGFKGDFTNDRIPSQLFMISTWPEVAENNDYVRILRDARDNPNSIYNIVNPSTHDNEFYNDPEWHEQMKVELGIHGYNREVAGIEDSSLEEPFIPTETLATLIPKKPIRMNFLYNSDVDEEGYYVDFKNFHNLREPYDAKYNYIAGLWIFSEPHEEKEYGISCDVSTGRSGDFSTMQVFDLETLEQVAEYKGKASTEDFKKMIRRVGEFYNNARISVERNSMGEGICQWFAYGDRDEDTNKWLIEPYENFYFSREKRNKITPGHNTDNGNRPMMLAGIQNALVKEVKDITINGERTISELKTLGFSRTGKVQGISNTDDLVMALGQFLYLREKFFLTDKQVTGSLLFGDSILVKDAEEKERREKHYYGKFEAANQETEEFLDFAKSLGASVNFEELIE